VLASTLTKRLTFRGFIVSDYWSQYPDFIRDMSAWIREGKVKYREDVVNGIENTVSAFQGLLKGKNFGKMLVRM
jgi:NADPH-dependent curcumin reductase CurA